MPPSSSPWPSRAAKRALRGVAAALAVTMTMLAATLPADAADAHPATGAVSTRPLQPSMDCQQPPSPPPIVVIAGGTYGDTALSDAQAHAAELVIAVGKAMGITDRGVRVALAAAAAASSLQADARSGSTVGLFGQPADGYTRFDRADPVGASRMFYLALVGADPGFQADPRSDAQIVELVQGTSTDGSWEQAEALATELTDRFYAAVPPYDFYPAPPPTLPAYCFDVAVPADGAAAADEPGHFDAGDIISDAVFYDTAAMSEDDVRAFIDSRNAACDGPRCLRSLIVDAPPTLADRYCAATDGGTLDAAAVITRVAVACGINPQVMLVTLQKESGLLTRSSVTDRLLDAAWGWHCPSSGPGGAALCDTAHAGFFAQAYGSAKQWARYRVDPSRYRYRAGESADIAWNVASSGCGSAPVFLANTATASLYNYTPYQPNAAALANYPGRGDACSSYGNRNFYFLFTDYFGSTHRGGSAGDGGATAVPDGTAVPDATAVSNATAANVAVTGTSVTIPAAPGVPSGLVGQVITAPTPAVAVGIAAGLATLGTPYVWGGGTYGGPADQGCARGGGQYNSCQGMVGFDCSGLTAYVLREAGFAIPANSAGQRAGGVAVPWASAAPGDLVGYRGHVAVYLGSIEGTEYLLEAPYPGEAVRIRAVYSSSNGEPRDPVVHRYWS